MKYDKPLIQLDLKKVFFLILHHIEKAYAEPEEIHLWHKERGWNGAGYNEYIRKDGSLIIMRGDNIGAHCENMNSKSYGIAVEGNYDIEKSMPEAQRLKLIERIKYHKARIPNKVEVVPHSKFVKTDCPGRYFPFTEIILSLDDAFCSNVDKLYSRGIINSKEYWLTNCQEGKYARGEFVKILINNIAKKL